MTILGTRPEIIRLSRVIRQLDQFCDHVLAHTGQNYDPMLNDVFFDELGVRQPDIYMGVKELTFADQIGQILSHTGRILAEHKPDRLLLLGDTNSALSAIVAARMGIPVYHMEAGNRCYDNRVPEEINRRIIDHSSDVLMPYTHRSKENLLHEGVERQRIFVVGNPIYEVLQAYQDHIGASQVLRQFDVSRQAFFLATLHRAENVDQPARLSNLLEGLSHVGETYQQPVLVSLHPRTAHKIASFGISIRSPWVRVTEPLGFFDFVALEQQARCVLSDSGTVQEECCILGVPNVTIRDVTERAETIEVGSNILSGVDPDMILHCVKTVLRSASWVPPVEYTVENVSQTVVKIILGYHYL